MLVGREAERGRLDGLLADARAGQSAVLALRAAPGTGKTVLLDYAAARAEGFRLLRAWGVESERELPFAGLHQLCGPLLGQLEQVPEPQRAALGTAFGLRDGARPDRFLISLAVLTLLSEVAEETPLLVVVDDAQWLDRSSAQVLAFVARRLQAESIAVLLAVREPAEDDEFAGLPGLPLDGLSDGEARELLASVIGAPLDARVRERILAEARGNPLALLELPAEVAGGFSSSRDLPLQGQLEASFLRRVQALPAAAQALLLLAAAEPTGEPALLWRSAAELGIAGGEIGPAEADGMVDLGPRVAFRHPLLRSAIYRAAPAEDRRAAHRALAVASDGTLDPDRRAWHLAQAATGPDADIADDLERSAGRARARGGVAASAAFLQRASALTLDPGERARRALRAAAAKQLAGAPKEAFTLLSAAADGPLDELDRAMLARLHGQIALDLRRGGMAVPLLLDAARRLETVDPGRARETYLEALRAASVAGRLGGGMLVAATAARGAPPRPGPPHEIDLLLDGLALRFTQGYAASAESLKAALVAVRTGEPHGDPDVRWPWTARRVAPDLLDDDTWHALATRNVQIARETGTLAVLPLALNYLSLLRCFEGDLASAAALLDEADDIAVATGTSPIVFGRVLLAGCRGDEAHAGPLLQASEALAVERGEGVVLTFGEHARALLNNGLGKHAAALAPAMSAGERDELMLSVWSLPELVEAAARCGRTEVAVDAAERFAGCASAAGTELGLGMAARLHALVSDGASAEEHHREAIDRLGRSRIALELARARLLYGEWLRREGRRADARAQLRLAHEMFSSMGAQAFEGRARRELLATGERVRTRTPDTRDQLTPQEAQVAQLARDGLSNPEIGARLFISPRTVQYHLRKVFAKLGISSRGELDTALPTGH